jgi:N-acetylglucosaminyldiphosphoundecaprenol N-acetyl-beta-D-mannosaminyltransferase
VNAATGNSGRREPGSARIALRALSFDPVTEADAVATVIARMQNGVGGRVVTPNVDILRLACRDPEMAELFNSADLCVADGMPIVWALRLRGDPVPERVAGSSFAPNLAAAAAEAGIGVFLLGGNPGSAQRAAERLRASYPTIAVGWHCPPVGFEKRPTERAAIDAAVRAFGPSICLVGLGAPKQDQLARELLAEFPHTWFVSVGATIGFMAGEFARAPGWMQAVGLEWLHRLALEPRRLAGRYLGRDLPFAVGLLLDSARGHYRFRSSTKTRRTAT